MSTRSHWLVSYVVCGLLHVHAAEVATQDGLALQIAPSGAVSAVAVDGKALPLLAGATGGFRCRELVRKTAAQPKTILSLGFDAAEQKWRKHDMMKVGESAACALKSDRGAGGSKCYVRLGEAKQYGDGFVPADLLPVRPCGLYRVSWQARVPNTGSTYIVYVQAFDADRRDITKLAQPSGKWRYSPYSFSHYQYPIGTKQVGDWERLAVDYAAAEGVHFLRIGLCLWRGDYVDADAFEVEEIGEAGWHDVELRGEVQAEAGRLRQRASGQGLALSATFTPQADHIRVEAEIESAAERAIELAFALPVQAEGWWWDDGIRTRRRIAGDETFEKSFACRGHQVSLYPFSSIHTDAAGLALGVPMDWPRLERRTYDSKAGYRTAFDLGLSQHTRRFPAGKATVAFVIYRHDAAWGLRAAADKYYKMFPQFFAKRAKREGTWFFALRPSEAPYPKDFGFTFWEGFSTSPKERELARETGMYIFPYTEAWGIRQFFPEAKERTDMPPYEERLAQLKALAADKASTKKWRGGPRHEVAQATLNSLPQLADGKAPFMEDKYGTWAMWWRTNSNPHLAEPNRASICKKYRMDVMLPHADGIYLDSVSLWLASYHNYRTDHIAATGLPLTFDPQTGRPALCGVFSMYEFIDWLASDLHGQGKLVHANIFSGANRFYAHLTDVLGSEVGGLVGRGRRLFEIETDEVSCMRRTFAYRRPTTNLLQEGSYRKPQPPITHEQVLQYVQHQAFYGFYPGISTGGGEKAPGYKNWKRYFRSPEFYERDRSIFQKYLPLIRRINRAGWEPITHARSAHDKVLVERFGSWRGGNLHFTVRNQSDAKRRASVRIDAAALGISAEARVSAMELVSNAKLPAMPSEGALALGAEIDAYDTLIVSVAGE